jgi:acetylornithine deacetylase/succinyl-diaminopimelate desuccinylase-like protein
MSNINQYIGQNKERFLNELLDLLRIPSISADPKYKADMLKMAKATSESLKKAGCKTVKILPTNGHPIVYGEHIIDKSKPTILVYGHYDVQPPDPLDLWDSPPFEPVIKKTKIHPQGAIFARGACDDKGQFYMHVKAFEAMIACKELPCNVKFMIEGEEEIGSKHLGEFCKTNAKLLACDVIVISDTSIISNKQPSVTVGLRGLSYIEVEVVGANRDLHSGVYGGAVANPIQVLSEMLVSLKDKNGKITIPGFYDEIIPVSKQERAAMNKAPFNLNAFKKDLGVKDLKGEKGYTALEQTSIRPTLEINGMWGGYIGEGAKTVLPSKANAKISMRLVPGQDHDKITKLFKKHFESIAPSCVKVSVKPHHGGAAYITPVDTVEYKAAAMAMEKSFKKEAIPVRGGGSIPIVALFEKVLGAKSVLMGFGLDSDVIHSPNENYGIFNYFKGIETIPEFFKNYTVLKENKNQ